MNTAGCRAGQYQQQQDEGREKLWSKARQAGVAGAGGSAARASRAAGTGFDTPAFRQVEPAKLTADRTRRPPFSGSADPEADAAALMPSAANSREFHAGARLIQTRGT